MSINLLVTERGQVTLPAALRAKLGIKPGDVVVAQERDGGLLLQAAAVIPYREYSDSEVKAFVAADTMSPALAARWEKKFGKAPAKVKAKRRK